MNTWSNTIFTLTLNNGEVYKAWGLGGIALFRDHLRHLRIAKIEAELAPIDGCRFLKVSAPSQDWAEVYGELRFDVVFMHQIVQHLCHKAWGKRAFYEWLTAEEIGQEMGGN